MLLDANPVSRCHLIAGQKSGKPVYITPQAKPIYDELYKLAKRSNYWAQVTVKGIQELAAGRLHMNNIFVHPGNARRDGKEEFVVVLPGCKVTAEKLDGDGYKLLHFAPDLSFFTLNDSTARPGMWKVDKVRDKWATSEIVDGSIKKSDDRIVVVTDSGYGDTNHAAKESARAATTTPFHGQVYVERVGFDMMYTPDNSTLGGLRNYRRAISPNKMEEINGSALILARAMALSAKQKGVVWVSERGGASVLSQALKILADQGGKLNNHHLYMIEPTVTTSDAIKSAQRLEMKLDRDVTKVGVLNIVGNRGQVDTIVARWRGKNENYTTLQAGVDLTKMGLSVQGGIAALTTLGGLAAAVGGVSISAPAVPALLVFAAAVAGGTIGAVQAAATITREAAPDFYHKLKAKL